MTTPDIQQAATLIEQAEALAITCGAGMGVDSGLPDFRGDNGFWQAYPMYKHLGINFYDAANPSHFADDPAFGWGFYGHRTNLYRSTTPHSGFNILKKWSQRFNLDSFVVTSNVDGQFQKAEFDTQKILEVHGSIHHLQCLRPCCQTIWNNKEETPVNLETMRAQHLPMCPYCQGVARPNILMFGDFSWISARSDAQEQRFHDFLDQRSTYQHPPRGNGGINGYRSTSLGLICQYTPGE
ncbi:MAG: NAD-dependent deacetylase [Desulfobacteraceae bacterium 4572_35.1]|nr:MAG: NAD-dependent deacetylase [Desulfobacteraceae bacterium 4572_35.1]